MRLQDLFISLWKIPGYGKGVGCARKGEMEMLYIVDNIVNYLIYLFIIYFGWRIQPRKSKLCIALSIGIMLAAGVISAQDHTYLFWTYVVWSLVSMILFFEDKVLHMCVLTIALMFFTGTIDTFTSIFLQIIFIGRGINDVELAWWMEPAYILSFLVYFSVYKFLLYKNEIYLCDIKLRYKIALFFQSRIFQLFYSFVFVFFDLNVSDYGWDAYVMFLISLIGIVYSIFLILELAVKNVLSDNQNTQLQNLMRMQQQQYNYQMQQSNGIRQFRHDLINHIGTVRELLNANKEDEAKCYIENMWKIVDNFSSKVHVGDDFMDAILNYYTFLCEKEKVAFEIKGKLTKPIGMEMLDITALLGNILQNAYEASKKTKNPRVTVKILEHRKEVFLWVSNTCKKKVKAGNKLIPTTKVDKINHGFGMKNILEIVKKYKGECYYSTVEKDREIFFEIKISIPDMESQG